MEHKTTIQYSSLLEKLAFLYVFITFFRFAFFPANIIITAALVFCGLAACFYVLTNLKYYNWKQGMLIFGLIIYYLASALISGYYDRVFHGLIFILINCGVALVLVSAVKVIRILLYFNYFWVSYFFMYVLLGVSPRDVFSHTGHNSISIILLCSCIITYIAQWVVYKRISIFPAFLTFILCVWSIGRGGIVSSFSILVMVIFYQYSAKINRAHLSIYLSPIIALIFVLVFFIGYVPIDGFLDFFSTLEAVQVAMDRAENVEPRFVLLEEYLNNLSWINIFFGTNILDLRSSLILDVVFNFHNSFLHLHSRLGFYFFILSIFSLFAFVKYFRTNKVYLLLFLGLNLRAYTDSFLFFESFDFIYFYFLFFALSNKFNLDRVKCISGRATPVGI